jgi:hypothetical protein
MRTLGRQFVTIVLPTKFFRQGCSVPLSNVCYESKVIMGRVGDGYLFTLNCKGGQAVMAEGGCDLEFIMHITYGKGELQVKCNKTKCIAFNDKYHQVSEEIQL